MSTDALAARRINIDRFYTNLSIGIAADQPMIGDTVLPVLRTDLSSVKIRAFGTEAWRIIDDLVGDYSMPQRVQITADKITVEVDGHALENPISDRHQLEATRGPAAWNLEQESMFVLKQRMLLWREKLQADLVTDPAVYQTANKTDLNGVEWDTAVDPFDAIIAAIETNLPNVSGRRPNVFWMGQPVWAKFIVNAAVKNRIYGTTNPQGVPTLDQIASLIGVDRVVVGRAVSRTAGGTVTQLWGKNAGLLYAAPTAGTSIPAFGYTVEQSVFGSASEAVVRIRDEHMGASGGFYLKRSHFYSPVITFANAGYLWYNAVQ
jgi:hypothetical protein